MIEFRPGDEVRVTALRRTTDLDRMMPVGTVCLVDHRGFAIDPTPTERGRPWTTGGASAHIFEKVS